MKIISALSISLVAALLISACKKEKSKEGNTPPVKGTCDYAPYTAGSTFTYENINNKKDTMRYTLTVGGDTTVNGVKYVRLGNDSTHTFIRCNEGDYVQIADALRFQDYIASDLKTTYLKDYPAIGNSWNDTVEVSDGTRTVAAIIKYTISQKGISKTVLGRNFADVITVRVDGFALVLGNPVSVGTIGTVYYAKGTGMIETDADGDTTRLKSFSIK